MAFNVMGVELVCEQVSGKLTVSVDETGGAGHWEPNAVVLPFQLPPGFNAFGVMAVEAVVTHVFVDDRYFPELGDGMVPLLA